MEFLSQEHEKNFNNLIKKGDVRSGDIERKSMFYIISGNNDLFKQVNNIYNFKDDELQERKETLEGDLYFPNVLTSNSSQKLLNLAVQLFNNTKDQNVLDTFSGLDSENFQLALNAIKIRFNQQ